MQYINQDERYGDAVFVTLEDYQELNPEGQFTVEADGIYENGVRVAYMVAEQEGRTEAISLRLSPSELAALDAARGEMSRSDYIAAQVKPSRIDEYAGYISYRTAWDEQTAPAHQRIAAMLPPGAVWTVTGVGMRQPRYPGDSGAWSEWRMDYAESHQALDRWLED